MTNLKLSLKDLHVRFKLSFFQMSPSNFIQDKNSTMFLSSTLLDFYLFLRPIKKSTISKKWET